MEVKDWRFPMACPKCQAAAGFPIRVTPDVVITADIFCRACHHQWMLSAVSPPLLLRQKKDLRLAELDRSNNH